MKAIVIIIVIGILAICFGVSYFLLELAKACCINESEDYDTDEETDRK